MTCWDDFDDALRAGVDRIILYGPPGLGKTRAALGQRITEGGAFRLVCHGGMTIADVVGMWMPTGAGTLEWRNGPALAARRGNGVVGGRCVADEIDTASGEVTSVLMAMFDSAGSDSWMNPYTEEMESPVPGYTVVMTTNLRSPEMLPAALADRFPVKILVDVAHPAAIAALPKDLQRAAELLTQANRNPRFSLREIEAFALMRETLPVEQAARLAFGPKADSATPLRVAAVAK